jgi:hypothetical protein
MPSCRNDRRWTLAATIAALALLTAAAARAQIGPPTPLSPPPAGSTGGTPTPAAAAPQAAPTAPPAGDAIRGTPLAPVDSAWLGTLGADAHPLPETMWQGTPRRFVAAALPELRPTTSPFLQQLARRLLLSNAVAPPGQDPPKGPSLATLRVERLIALGDIDGALAVLDALPAETHTDALDHARAELYFAKNDVATGCHRVEDGIARYQSIWWQRALIACQALAGERAKVSLGLSLLREQKVPPDRVFDELIAAVDGHPVRLAPMSEPSPILMTLLAAAKRPLPAETAAKADLPSLLAWAGNPSLPPLQRLAAAERATAFGAMPPEALAALYAKVEFRPDELGAAIKRGKAPVTPRDRALLYQVARTDPAAAVRATALKALLVEAEKRGDYFTTAHVVAPILAELPANDDLAPFASEAVRALYAGGRPDAATPWLVHAAPGTATLLAALARQPDAGEAAKPPRDAVTAVAGRDPSQAAMLLALLAALDLPVGPDDWAPLIAGAPGDSVPGAIGARPAATALWMDQRQAAAKKRIGETVLATLILARSGDRLSSEPIVVAKAVSGLEAVGLDGDAHALAVEAAIGAGL